MLQNGLDIGDVFGEVTFDLIIASECMYYFTDKERKSLNGKFRAVMNDNSLIYINMPTYDSPLYIKYKNIPKNADGMVKVSKSGRIDNSLDVNLPNSIEGLKEMFSEFSVLDVVTTDMPLYSNQRNVEYHMIAKK